MNFNEHCIGKGLYLFRTGVDINQLISFLQNNKNITELSLISCKIFSQGVEALANSEHLKNLTTLNLKSNYISDQDAEALANSEHLKNLTTLNLKSNRIGDQGAEALANSEHLKNLTTLNLKSNLIGSKGVEALANSEHLKNLTTLNLKSNRIGDQGAEALANSEHLKNLTTLNLKLNDIGDQGAEALAKGNLVNLTTLDLSHNHLGDQGAEALAKGNLVNLTTLDLSHNHLGDKGAEALAKGNLVNLTTLDLSDNHLGDKGAKALAKGNLVNLTILNLSRNEISNEGVEALDKSTCLENVKKIDLEFNHISLSHIVIKDLLESRKCFIIKPSIYIPYLMYETLTCFCQSLESAWYTQRAKSKGNVSKLDEDVAKQLLFDLARRNDDTEGVKLLLNDSDKYPFLINSKDEQRQTLSHFYTHNPEMQKFFFECGMIPEEERRDDQRIVQNDQSVHLGPVVKRINFFAKKLIESVKDNKEQLEQVVDSYVKNIELFREYKEDSIKLRLLSLTDNEKRGVMERVLHDSLIPNDEEFIKAVVDKAEQALNWKYLRKNAHGEYDEGYPTARMQYDYARDDAKITIPESIGYVKMLIDKFLIPLQEKKELLTTLMEQNPELVRKKLPTIRKELGNSGIFDKEQFNKRELHELLNDIDDSKKIDKLFKEISSLDIEKVWREQKEFVLLKQIYIAATTYGEDSSACIQGTWSQIISSINEISSEIMAQYDHRLEEEQNLEARKYAITKENIKPLLQGLADRLIQYVKDNPELKEVLQNHLLYLEHIDINDPEKVTFEQQKILSEVNKYFGKNIRDVLPNYNRIIPIRGEYALVIEGLLEIEVMQHFAQEGQSPFDVEDNSNSCATISNSNTDEEFKDTNRLPIIAPPALVIDSNSCATISNSNTDEEFKDANRLPIIAPSALVIVGIISGIAIAVYLEMLAVGIAVGACCLVIAAIIYYCNKPSKSLENVNAEAVVNQTTVQNGKEVA